MTRWLLFFILTSLGAFAVEAATGVSPGTATLASDGSYLTDVQGERQQRFYEIFLFAEPPPKVRPLHALIFNSQLSKEFKEKYREKFGQADTESISYQRTDYSRLEANKSMKSTEEKNQARRAFSEYMMKRLMEWHLDNYVKSEPAMRPVFEAKEKLKKVELRVTKDTKVEGRYDLAGNTMDFIYENSVCDTKWTVEMDPSSFGPGSVVENKVIFGRPVNSRLRAENRWTSLGGRSEAELIRSHTERLVSTYTVSAAYKATQKTGETRIAAGLSYSF